jgi:mono/diheme cytochrome c family protein
MRAFFAGVVATLLAIACGVFGVSRLGLFPIGADNPPGSLETTLAGTAMARYVERHKPAVKNPVEPTPANLITGAREYEEHCAFCHGGAKSTSSPMRDKFNPPTPQMIESIPDADDAFLFWITKHGVRMTGMPAWDGILSDDEIWKIVAFIKHSDQLPAEVYGEWYKMGATPGEIKEHTPRQHERAPESSSPRR